MDIFPKEIIKDIDTNVEYAHYGYYEGIKVAEAKKLKQTITYKDVRSSTHFIVSCGDVVIRVLPTDYPTIERRLI